MAPLIAMALPSIISAVPDLIRLFGKNAEHAEKNAKAAELVVGAAKEAIGAVNEQDLMEKIESGGAEIRAQVQAAVQEIWYDLAVDFGGIDAARAANQHPADVPFWKQPAIWVTGALLPLVYLTVMTVLQVKTPWGTISDAVFSGEVQSMVISAMISGVLGGVSGFWLGTSFSSQRKTELMGERSKAVL